MSYYIFMRRIFRHKLVQLALVLAASTAVFAAHGGHASAATGACTAPSTDYGTVTSVVNIAVGGNYRVWSRVSHESTTPVAISYKLQITSPSGSVDCYTVGDTVAKANNNWRWVDYTTDSGNPKINHPFTATGNYTVKMIGTSEGMLLDRLIFTKVDPTDGSTCTPENTVHVTSTSQVVGYNCADDNTSPTASFVGTNLNSSLSGAVTVTAAASDDSGTVSKVEFYIGSTLKGTFTPSGGNYVFIWDTTSPAIADGTYIITAKAYDAAGNSPGVVSKTVTVANGKPDLVVAAVGKSPATVNLNNSVTFNATIKNNGSVAAAPGSVTFKVDGSVISTATSSTLIAGGGVATQTVTLTTPWLATAGSHSVTATVDSANVVNEGTAGEANNVSSALTFTVNSPDINPPTIVFSSPTGGTVQDQITLRATASDTESGISSVVFYDGITLIGTGTKSGSEYSVSWDTGPAGNGSHTLKAEATDGAGNKKSTTVTVTVDNTVPVVINGDADNDGDVDFDDLDTLSRHWLLTGQTKADGNFDGDSQGNVDFDDLDILSRTFTG